MTCKNGKTFFSGERTAETPKDQEFIETRPPAGEAEKRNSDEGAQQKGIRRAACSRQAQIRPAPRFQGVIRKHSFTQNRPRDVRAIVSRLMPVSSAFALPFRCFPTSEDAHVFYPIRCFTPGVFCAACPRCRLFALRGFACGRISPCADASVTGIFFRTTLPRGENFPVIFPLRSLTVTGDFFVLVRSCRPRTCAFALRRYR